MKELSERKASNTRLQKRAFFMMFETAVVLAVPAFLVLALWKYFDLSNKTMFISLAVAFIFSWIVIIYRVKAFSKTF